MFFTFQPVTTATNLQPDMVLWSKSIQCVFIKKLKVSSEEAINGAFKKERLLYANLATEVSLRPVEVGCRGFVTSSTKRLQKKVSVREQDQQTTIKELVAAAAKSLQPSALAEEERGSLGCIWSLECNTHPGLISLW